MLTKKEKEQASKTLSYVLRHRPDEIDLKLNENGWCDIDSLIDKLNAWETNPIKFSKELVETLVIESDKQRFALTADKKSIRANQGHSVKINIDFPTAIPPENLYHGTISNNLAGIEKEGLKSMSRHHVHLSVDVETATKVGMRYGKPVILIIDAKKLHEDGYTFYKSENDVYLIENVDAKYIQNLSSLMNAASKIKNK